MFHHKPTSVKCQWDSFKIIDTPAKLEKFIAALKTDGTVHAIDFETTSLKPAEGRVRLSNIYGPAGWVVIDHDTAGAFADCVDDLIAACGYCVYNVKFEGSWFDYYSNDDAVLYDIAYLRKAKMGGAPDLGLAHLVKTELKEEMSKELQNSNWAAPVLTAEQYAYAADDAKKTFRIWDKWLEELTPQHWGGYMVLNEAWRATKEAEDTGLILDVQYHESIIKRWTLRAQVAERYLRQWAPPSVLANLNSKQQIGNFLRDHILDDAAYRAWPRTTGVKPQLDTTREVLRIASSRLPYPMSRWVAALIVYNRANKYLSTYGEKLITNQRLKGAITSRFNIAAAVTGRYSSSSDNLQNIPRSKVVRKSFVANVPNAGAFDQEYRLILGDYSSVEVRVLGVISGDDALLHEAVYGDVHATSAADRLKMDPALFKAILKDKTHKLNAQYKELRARAKALTFAVCYGAGMASLAVSLRCSVPEAIDAFNGWAKRYPKAFAYRQVMYEKMVQTGFLNVADGRSIYVHKNERSLPVAANYGIQGAAASVMYRWMYHCNRMLNEAGIRCRIAATVHDELLLRSHVSCADQALEILEKSAAIGWLDIFPGTSTENLCDGAIGMSWADKS